jgi:hypothetical protein
MGDRVKPIIERHGSWRIALSDVDDSAAFEALEWRREIAKAEPPGAEQGEFSVSAEVLQFGGGLMPRALLGGTFMPGGTTLAFEVGSTGSMTLGAIRDCRSLLGGALVRGLPSEFVEAVLGGLSEMAGRGGQSGGTLRIHAAGYDEQNSSAYAFRHAGAALLWLVTRRIEAPDDVADGLAEMVSMW